MKKQLSLYLLFFLLSISLISAQAVLYSEKFRIDTSNENSTISFPIRVKNANNLYALKIDLSYDPPSVLAYSGIIPGQFLTQDGASLFNGISLNLTTAGDGTVSNIILSRQSTDIGVNGDGLLLTVNFTKSGTGVTDITLTQVELSDPDANPITGFNVYYLTVWDDTNTQPKYIGDNVNFFAILEDSSANPVQTSCVLNVQGSNYNMQYQQGTYSYAKSFSSIGSFPWTVTCTNYYTVADTVIIGSVESTQEPPLADTEPPAGQDGGGGGGGGGGGASSGSSVAKCQEQWVCDQWSGCTDNKKTRTCTDTNNCKNPASTPETQTSCGDTCFDGLKNNGETNVDCGGPCKKQCSSSSAGTEASLESPIFQVLTKKSDLSQGKLTLKYDNQEEPKKSGVYFNIQIKDKDGNVLIEEAAGPFTLEEDSVFEQSFNMPYYLLEEGSDYIVSGVATQKGKTLIAYEKEFTMETKPAILSLLLRVLPIFGIIAVITVIVSLIYISFLKKEI